MAVRIEQLQPEFQEMKDAYSNKEAEKISGKKERDKEV